MDRGKMSSSGRGGKSKAPQHPQDIFALGTKSTVVVSRDQEKRNIHKPSSSGVERKREGTSTFGAAPPTKRSRIGSPAEAVGGTSLEVDPVDLVPNVLQALDTHNSDKLLGLLTGSIRLLKSQRSKPDPILCMSMLYLCKIRPNMFAHDVVTQSLCTLLKREQGAAFKSKGNPLVFVLACNMLYAGHRDSNNWPDTFIKVYIEDALNERWWVECSWCKCLVENIATAFSTKTPPPHLIPSDSALAAGGTMSPSGSGSPLMGSTDDDPDNTDLEYTVFPRYSSSYETVEALVLEAIKDQIQRRAAPDAIGKGFLKLLSATCGFPEIRMISASRLEAWLHSGKLWRAAQELLAYVCCNADACGPTAARDHEVLAQLARMRLKTKPLQQAYQACLREMVSDSPALLRSVVTHTIYNELSNVRSPNNMAVLAALIQAQPQAVPAAMADTYQELVLRQEDYLRPLRALSRECVRAARADAQALVPLARALAMPPPHEPPQEIRERAFNSIADLFCCLCLVTASHSKHIPEYRQQLCVIQCCALGWLLDTAAAVYRPQRHDFQLALNKIMFVEPADTYSKPDNWPPESERALTYRLCCETPLPQNTLLRVIFIGLAKEIPVGPAETFELVEQLVRRACALPPDDTPLPVDKLELADYVFQLCQFTPPDNITLPPGYTAPPLAITSLYWRGWILLVMLAAHNPGGFAERAAAAYPTLRALVETCITSKPSVEWSNSAAEAERLEAERAAVLQLETHLAAASNAKLPITEHNSRLLSQLTTLDPLGPARKPPASILESLQQTSQALRLGRLLCRQPALLLELVERHGTRRAMPWLHQLLRHDQLELSVLPVQCLCEFLSAGGAGGEAGKAGELAAHLRRTVASSEEGARAVLQYYTQRLAHSHAPTRAQANRGLKLVLTQAEDTAEMDYNADVGPEEWLELLVQLRHWDAVRDEVLARLRAACLAECVPRHLAAYIAFLAEHADTLPPLVLDLSQVVMERQVVIGGVLPPAEPRAVPDRLQHRTLHAITSIFYTHLRKARSSGALTAEAGAEWGAGGAGGAEWGAGGAAAGDLVTLQWSSAAAAMPSVVAHAHYKLLCYGPSAYDTNQEMYSWLESVWVGEPPTAFAADGTTTSLLPDWLRLHLVRSARPALLELGLRALPAHKLALFIQTFGMPRSACSALLAALDACPTAAVLRLGVERGYMAQLLQVQRARGCTGGEAFAAALRLQPPPYPPDDTLFEEEPLPSEDEDECAPIPLVIQPEQVPALLTTAFCGGTYPGDLDEAFTELNANITEEVKKLRKNVPTDCPYIQRVTRFLQAADSTVLRGMTGAGHAAVLLRSLTLARWEPLREVCSSLLKQFKCPAGPVANLLTQLAAPERRATRTVPHLPHATKEQLIAALEAATPNTLEAIGNRIIETQNTRLVVDVISTLLEKNQQGAYESEVKVEVGAEPAPPHVFARRGLGCGLLLDWMSELQRETLGPQPERQMRLMFRSGSAAWRPLLVTLLAHRASWRTLHTCLSTLLQPNGGWAASGVLDFAETLMGSERVWQGRDRAAPKHQAPCHLHRLTHTQLEVLIKYIMEEASEAGPSLDSMRRRIEARLPLALRCAPDPPALLAAAAAAEPLLLLLLYMKVPKIRQLLMESAERPLTTCPLEGAEPYQQVAASSTSATDRVSHTLLTALAHPNKEHGKEANFKSWRLEAGVRSLWARVAGAGARALPLAGALLRGSVPAPARAHLLSALELLPDHELQRPDTSEEVQNILECFVQMAAAGGRERDRDSALQHRVAALMRRVATHSPPRTHGSLSALGEEPGAAPASAAPPPLALLALQRRDPPDDLHVYIQEIDQWGSRRGGAWGGPGAATALLRALAPLCAEPGSMTRTAALGLLTKLLPAVPDPTPGLDAIMECLDSSLPEVAQSVIDKLPELVVGMQEHAARILLKVFELGVRSRLPVETSLARSVAAINLQRGC
ncbi:integrator complex subunit 1 [Cydia strobilella]|uniref:integrator complex subunit 1 n=1 Tax=Cydia strobilella TaxID=1100964 RepID=UPI0030041D70